MIKWIYVEVFICRVYVTSIVWTRRNLRLFLLTRNNTLAFSVAITENCESKIAWKTVFAEKYDAVMVMWEKESHTPSPWDKLSHTRWGYLVSHSPIGSCETKYPQLVWEILSQGLGVWDSFSHMTTTASFLSANAYVSRDLWITVFSDCLNSNAMYYSAWAKIV